jgi:hypothetical protein
MAERGGLKADHQSDPAHGSVAGTLAVGSGVHADETIGTDKGGVAGLRFHDQSSLDVGPNSSVRLNKFIYDPNRSGGKRLRCRQGFVPVLDRRAGRQSKHSDQDPGWDARHSRLSLLSALIFGR